MNKPNHVPIPDTVMGALPAQKRIASMIRVDLAGETGARRIYEGQRAVLGKDPYYGPLLEHMQQQEQEHYDYFASQARQRGVRPSALDSLWQIGGFALGAVTALMSKEAAMACTVAVEEVIDEHYAHQMKQLKASHPQEVELYDKIDQFRKEEQEHRDIGLEHDAAAAAAYPMLRAGISGLCRVAIAVAKRV